MGSVTIKRETYPYRSIVLLFITSIPIGLFSYAAYDSIGSSSKLTFSIIAGVFLLPALIDFTANKLLPLKPAITISDKGLVLSLSKGIYDSFSFLSIFQKKRKRLISWQDITVIDITVGYQPIISYPNEGETTVNTRYAKPQHQLRVQNKTRNQPLLFSLDNLEKTPDEILSLCNQFIKKQAGQNQELIC